jgi:TolB-like protein
MVVLPFANIGGDAEQEPFVDGVTESLTTDLSRIRGSFVIGRNTAFTYKGKAVDLKQIGRELNVRYVLEGSVQRSKTRMRVNVQLIDAESGNHLWAERFDKQLADLFDMQDEIVARLASSLNAQLLAAEARRAEQAPNPDSMDLYFQGMAWLNKGRTPYTLGEARVFFDRALTADPGNIDALIGSATADALEGVNFFVTDPAVAFAAAEAKLCISRAWRRTTFASTSKRSRGLDGRPRPTEIFRPHIFGWAPRSRGLIGLTRRVPPSKPGSRSTRPSPCPAPAPAGGRGATTQRIWPSLSPFSKVCARPGCRKNDRGTPALTLTPIFRTICITPILRGICFFKHHFEAVDDRGDPIVWR